MMFLHFYIVYVLIVSSECQTEGKRKSILEYFPEFVNLKKEVAERKGSGNTYIRWGRTSCPGNGTELVYAGYTGGGYYYYYGAPAEPICLTSQPNFLKTSAGSRSHIYGAEFESNFFGPNSDENDVPCAVCEVQPGSTSIMIPGRTTCYPGWKVEYYGNLAAGSNADRRASAFICIDVNPDYREGGKTSSYGYLLYEVTAKCGSLPCPPYENSYPVSCVICSK